MNIMINLASELAYNGETLKHPKSGTGTVQEKPKAYMIFFKWEYVYNSFQCWSKVEKCGL